MGFYTWKEEEFRLVDDLSPFKLPRIPKKRLTAVSAAIRPRPFNRSAAIWNESRYVPRSQFHL